jgi:hypothetical protein
MALTYRDEPSSAMHRNNGKIGPLITAFRAVTDAHRGG